MNSGHGRDDTAETFGIDLAALAGIMNAHGLEATARLGLVQLTGGQSNPTYRVTGAGHSYVLR